MKGKEIIEFTNFDDYYEKNNIHEAFRLPFKLLKDSSPLDLIDNRVVQSTPTNDPNTYINAWDYYYKKFRNLDHNSLNQLNIKYLDLFNSISEEKIDLELCKQEKFKADCESYIATINNSLPFHSIEKETHHHRSSSGMYYCPIFQTYLKTLIANGEEKYQILFNPITHEQTLRKKIWNEAKEKYIVHSMPSFEKINIETIPLTYQQKENFEKAFPHYSIVTIRIFTNYESPEESVYNKILNEDYLKLKELQKDALPLETFRSKVKYHSAHMKDNGEQYSLIEVLNKDEGVIRISDTLHNFLIKFIPTTLSKIMPKIWYGLNMELDEYAGLIAIDPNGFLNYRFGEGYSNNSYDYGNGKGRQYELLPQQYVGYILKPENAILNLFNNKLVQIENSKNGMLNIKTSDLDLNGYKCQLPTEFILELSQNAQPIKKQEKIKLKEEGEKKSISSNVQLQEKQESIKQEILQLSQAMIKLSDDFRAALIEEELITLSNKSLQIADHFQEFTNMLGFTTPENVVNLLGTENITEVHHDLN